MQLSQHQGYEYEDEMYLTFDYPSRTLECQFTNVDPLSNVESGQKIAIKMKLSSDNKKFISLKETISEVPLK